MHCRKGKERVRRYEEMSRCDVDSGMPLDQGRAQRSKGRDNTSVS